MFEKYLLIDAVNIGGRVELDQIDREATFDPTK